jgi:SAM-dependent methyltransferase
VRPDLTPEDYASVVVVKPPDYIDRYQEFLDSTDEKDVIAAALSPLLKPGSIVDIGAGTGDLAARLQVDKASYTAIEQHPEFATLLRGRGYQVIEELFPCIVPNGYDNVLLCYCLYGRKQCEIMIDSAWQIVDPGGRLIAVTFRDYLDDYNRLLHRIGHTRRGRADQHFDFLRDKFASLGSVEISATTSHIDAPDVGALAAILSFMATNSKVGTIERRNEICRGILAEQSYIDERYRVESGRYLFPVNHFIFVTSRA